jgi:hypothetical protein
MAEQAARMQSPQGVFAGQARSIQSVHPHTGAHKADAVPIHIREVRSHVSPLRGPEKSQPSASVLK